MLSMFLYTIVVLVLINSFGRFCRLRSTVTWTGRDEFVPEATKHIPKYKLDFVLNADQSSFYYEIASNRTLSYAGEKGTYLSVKSLNAISHSCTVMPIISAAGQLLSSVFICLQESTGRFPITRAVFSAANKVTSCSTSGKLNKSLTHSPRCRPLVGYAIF